MARFIRISTVYATHSLRSGFRLVCSTYQGFRDCVAAPLSILYRPLRGSYSPRNLLVCGKEGVELIEHAALGGAGALAVAQKFAA